MVKEQGRVHGKRKKENILDLINKKLIMVS